MMKKKLFRILVVFIWVMGAAVTNSCGSGSGDGGSSASVRDNSYGDTDDTGDLTFSYQFRRSQLYQSCRAYDYTIDSDRRNNFSPEYISVLCEKYGADSIGYGVNIRGSNLYDYRTSIRGCNADLKKLFDEACLAIGEYGAAVRETSTAENDIPEQVVQALSDIYYYAYGEGWTGVECTPENDECGADYKFPWQTIGY